MLIHTYINEKIWENLRSRAINLAAAFRTDWIGDRRTLERPIRTELQVDLGKAYKNRIAIVNSRTDKCMDY